VFGRNGAALSQARRTLAVVTAVHLPDELASRLAAEAARRGVTPDELAAETLAAFLPSPTGTDPVEAFIGSGDSGDPAWAGRPTAELRADADRRAS